MLKYTFECQTRMHVYTYPNTHIHTYSYIHISTYGVALVSRIDKITGLFCKRALSKRLYFAKETCNFIDPTNRSHPIHLYVFGSVHSYIYIYWTNDASAMGWLRLVGSLKLWASFAKEPCQRDDILQKRPVISLHTHIYIYTDK